MIRAEILRRMELFRLQPYRLFALSGLLATFGNGLIYVALSWYVYQQNRSVGAMALLMFCIWMPSIVFGPLFGVCADTYDRKSLLILSNAGRGLAVIGYVVALALGHTGNIYILASVLGIFVSFYMPAAIPLLKDLVPETTLVEANATVDMLYEVGTIAGMGVSGWLMLQWQAAGTFAIGGVCFLLSALLNHGMQDAPGHALPDTTPPQSVWHDYWQSIRYVAQHRHVWAVYGVQMVIMLLLMTIPILLVPFTQTVFQAGVIQFACFEALFSLGAFVGGFFSPMLCRTFSTKVALMILTALLSAGLLLFSRNHSIIIGYAIYFVIGFGLSSWAVAVTQSQRQTDAAFQGRLQATCYSVTGIGVLLLYLLMTFQSDRLDLPSIYGIESLLALAAFVMTVMTTEAPEHAS